MSLHFNPLIFLAPVVIALIIGLVGAKTKNKDIGNLLFNIAGLLLIITIGALGFLEIIAEQ